MRNRPAGFADEDGRHPRPEVRHGDPLCDDHRVVLVEGKHRIAAPNQKIRPGVRGNVLLSEPDRLLGRFRKLLHRHRFTTKTMIALSVSLNLTCINVYNFMVPTPY